MFKLPIAPLPVLKLMEVVAVKEPLPEIVPVPCPVSVSMPPLEMLAALRVILALPEVVTRDSAPVELSEAPVTVILPLAAWFVIDSALKVEDDDTLKLPIVLTMVAAPPGLVRVKSGVAVWILPIAPDEFTRFSDVVAVSVNPPV